jgi:hypothetical protein
MHHDSHNQRSMPSGSTILICLTYEGTLDTFGFRGDWGCGVPNLPRLSPQNSVPHDAQPYISLDELNDFVTKLNSISTDNYFPPWPCMPLFFCSVYQMIKKNNEHFEHANRTKYLPRNCKW